MADQEAFSKFIRVSKMVLAGILGLSGGLILVVGFTRSDNPYLPIELIGLMIGLFGIGGVGLLERWRRPVEK